MWRRNFGENKFQITFPFPLFTFLCWLLFRSAYFQHHYFGTFAGYFFLEAIKRLFKFDYNIIRGIDFQHCPCPEGCVENQFAPFRVRGKQIDFSEGHHTITKLNEEILTVSKM